MPDTAASQPTLRQLLVDARDRISDPANWTQQTMARNEHNSPCSPLSDYAVSFCAIGSLLRSAANLNPTLDPDDLPECQSLRNARSLLKHATDLCYSDKLPTISGVNDTFGHKAVLRLFDIAIQNTPE